MFLPQSVMISEFLSVVSQYFASRFRSNVAEHRATLLFLAWDSLMLVTAND